MALTPNVSAKTPLRAPETSPLISLSPKPTSGAPKLGISSSSAADLTSLILTKRIDRVLPLFLSLPLKRRFIACSPLLEPIDLRPYLDPTKIEQVTAAGESDRGARACHYDWLLDLKHQTEAAGIKFWLKSPGSNSIPTGQTSLGL